MMYPELVILAGIALLILNIVMIVKFFQIAKDIRAIKELFVDGRKEVEDDNLTSMAYRYYKSPLEETTKEEQKADKMKFVEQVNERRAKEE